ncbi:hypothetical protein [Rothia sp. P7208]|uniref:DoxX family protein n=1 Tax=Rothia sp. P7208 TaxID=3402660 RepID=UPI003ABF97DE
MIIFSSDPTEKTSQKITRYVLGAGLCFMGALHFKKDTVEKFASIVPPIVPGSAENIVYLSGVAELAIGGALLLAPRARKVSGLAATALFVAVFPANIYQYLEGIDIPGVFETDAQRLRRLPLQLPLIMASLYVARQRSTSSASPDTQLQDESRRR